MRRKHLSKIKHLQSNIVIVTLILLFFSVQPVFADLSKEEAIKIAQQRNGGGKVIGVIENSIKGKKSYDVKLISGGKVRILTVDE